MLPATSQRLLLADLTLKLRMRLKSTDLTRMVMESLATSLWSKPCKNVSTILRTTPSFVLVDKCLCIAGLHSHYAIKNKNGHHSINLVKNLRHKRRKIGKQFCKDLWFFVRKILGEMI